jgi:uncharacterized membrane protein YozB (DUF420 family)
MQLQDILPAVSASLNAVATVLLVAGYVVIRNHIRAGAGSAVAPPPAEARSADPMSSPAARLHRNLMLACFAVSVLFLANYLYYHLAVQPEIGPKKYEGPESLRTVYYLILFTHIPLAALVPVLAIITIVLGLRSRWVGHRRWAKVTFPIWLYVSVTGVLVYVFLYLLPTAR